MERHGMHNTSEYNTWKHMKDRCSNPNSQRWDRYGGRGISVCDRWNRSFLAFIDDMGMKPTPNHTLERINNDGDYTPDNCKWATREEQNQNRSDNRIIAFNGLSMHLAAWSRKTGIPKKTLQCRLDTGWAVSDALTLPVEYRPWNGNRKFTWKRRWNPFPLSARCMTILRAVHDGATYSKEIDMQCTPHQKMGAFKTLLKAGMVEVIGKPHDKKNQYAITEAGRRVIQAESAGEHMERHEPNRQGHVCDAGSEKGTCDG